MAAVRLRLAMSVCIAAYQQETAAGERVFADQSKGDRREFAADFHG